MSRERKRRFVKAWNRDVMCEEYAECDLLLHHADNGWRVIHRLSGWVLRSRMEEEEARAFALRLEEQSLEWGWDEQPECPAETTAAIIAACAGLPAGQRVVDAPEESDGAAA